MTTRQSRYSVVLEADRLAERPVLALLKATRPRSKSDVLRVALTIAMDSIAGMSESEFQRAFPKTSFARFHRVLAPDTEAASPASDSDPTHLPEPPPAHIRGPVSRI